MAYTDYEYRENDKIADVASQFNTTVEEIMRINNVQPPYPMYVKDLPESVIKHGQGEDTKFYLQVPFVTNGQQSFESYNSSSSVNLGMHWNSSQTLQRNMYNNAYGYADNNTTNIVNPHIMGFGQSGIACWISASHGASRYGNYIRDFSYMDKYTAWYFPCYPDNVSDSNQASYSPTSILGRSEPFQYYTGSGPRTVSVDFTMHSDMLCPIKNDTTYERLNYIYKLVSFIESCCYPNYNSVIAANRVIFHCTDSIHINGIISNVNTTYEGPILDMVSNNGTFVDGKLQKPKYAIVKVSFSVTEVSMDNNIPSALSVSNEGGCRQWGVQ